MKNTKLYLILLLCFNAHITYGQILVDSEKNELSLKSEADIVFDYFDIVFNIQLEEIAENIELLNNNQQPKGLFKNKTIDELIC